MVLELQKFLKAHEDNWYELLSNAPYFLKIQEKGNLVLFKYNQIKSNFNETICREARGIILEKGTWKVVRCAFFKFFNLGESYADDIDWDSASATQKEDGSLISLYFYNGWQVATNGMIDAADAELDNGGYKTFKDLVFAALVKYHDFDMEKLNPDYTYTFELCSPFNQVVCQYPDIMLFHTLTRDNTTLEEIEAEVGIPKPKFYNLNSQKEYQDLVDALPENTEGIVVKDAAGRRVKLKTLLYFELHRKANNGKLNLERVIELIRANDHEEFLSYFPQYADYFRRVKIELDAIPHYVGLMNADVLFWRDRNHFSKEVERREFAKYVSEQPLKHLFFKAFDGKLDSYVEKLTTAQFIKAFQLEDKLN